MHNIPARQRRALITLTMITLAYAFWMSAGRISIAEAASGISARYDGTYSGTAEPSPNNVSSRCAAFTLDKVSIANGQLKSPAPHPAIKGFITEEGYVQASLTGPDMREAAMDGRLQGDTIVAGYIDKDQQCNWIVRLRKQP